MIVRDLGITDIGEKQKHFSTTGGTLAPVLVEILIHHHLACPIKMSRLPVNFPGVQS